MLRYRYTLFFCVAWPKSAPPRSERSRATETERNAIFFLLMSSCSLPQPCLRIFRLVVLTDFEVEVAGMRTLRFAHTCKRLSSVDAVADGDGGRFGVAVKGETAVPVMGNQP